MKAAGSLEHKGKHKQWDQPSALAEGDGKMGTSTDTDIGPGEHNAESGKEQTTWRKKRAEVGIARRTCHWLLPIYRES